MIPDLTIPELIDFKSGIKYRASPWPDKIQKWPKYKVRRHQNLWHPPLQLKRPYSHGHLGERVETYPDTINLIEAIFEFPFRS